jgi:hypothetical protein
VLHPNHFFPLKQKKITQYPLPGLVLLGGGTVGFGFCNTLATIMAMRVVQGIGGGCINVAGMALLLQVGVGVGVGVLGNVCMWLCVMQSLGRSIDRSIDKRDVVHHARVAGSTCLSLLTIRPPLTPGSINRQKPIHQVSNNIERDVGLDQAAIGLGYIVSALFPLPPSHRFSPSWEENGMQQAPPTTHFSPQSPQA